MAFPTSPSDGEIHNGYKYNNSLGVWEVDLPEVVDQVSAHIVISGRDGTWNWKNDIIPMLEDEIGRSIKFAKCIFYGSNTAWSARYDVTLNKSYSSDAGGNIELIRANGGGCSESVSDINSTSFTWVEGNCNQAWYLRAYFIV